MWLLDLNNIFSTWKFWVLPVFGSPKINYHKKGFSFKFFSILSMILLLLKTHKLGISYPSNFVLFVLMYWKLETKLITESWLQMVSPNLSIGNRWRHPSHNKFSTSDGFMINPTWTDPWAPLSLSLSLSPSLVVSGILLERHADIAQNKPDP